MLACANWLLNHAAPVDVDDFEEFTDRWLRQVTEPEIDALVEAMRGIVSRPNVDMEMRNTVVELLSRWADSHLAAVERKLEPLLSDPVLAGYVREALGLDDEPGAA